MHITQQFHNLRNVYEDKYARKFIVVLCKLEKKQKKLNNSNRDKANLGGLKQGTSSINSSMFIQWYITLALKSRKSQ